MTDVLVFNPTKDADAVISFLKKNNLSYAIYHAPNVLYAYDDSIGVKVLGDINDDDQFTSIIAFGGYGWLDYYSSQILLSNENVDRSEAYTFSKPVAGCVSFNFVSYKGKHVLLDAFIFKQDKWLVFGKNQTGEYFVSRIKKALEFLDKCGVTNGPSQVHVQPDFKMSLALKPRTLAGRGVNRTSTKAFADIWPTIVTLESNNSPSKAAMAFDLWTEQHGPAEQFTLPSVIGKS
jgi:hypothetical protein